MYILRTDASFDSAHFLSGYEGKCSNIHGHRWTVEIEANGEALENDGQNRGMIVDFSELKGALTEIVEFYDHSLIIEKDSLKEKTLEALLEENFRVIEVPFRPTAENFSKHFFEKMAEKGYRIAKTTVYETPKNCASYVES